MPLQKLTVIVEINGNGAKCLRVKSLGLQSVFSKTIRCNVLKSKGCQLQLTLFKITCLILLCL